MSLQGGAGCEKKAKKLENVIDGADCAGYAAGAGWIHLIRGAAACSGREHVCVYGDNVPGDCVGDCPDCNFCYDEAAVTPYT